MIIKIKRWTEEQLRDAARESTSVRQTLTKLGLREAGGNYSQIKKFLGFYKVDIRHFKGKGWNKGMRGIGRPILALEDVLVKNSNYQSYKLKKRLFAEKIKLPKCEKCGWAQKAEDGRLPLELDHINGDSRDNRLKNLRVLCPNCHSLEPTHRGKNIKKLN